MSPFGDSNVAFRIHRINLQVNSGMFKGMFELPSSHPGADSAPIPVDDNSSALEIALPYVYSTPLPPLMVAFPGSWDVIKVFDKYEVRSRGRSLRIRALLTTQGVDRSWTRGRPSSLMVELVFSSPGSKLTQRPLNL